MTAMSTLPPSPRLTSLSHGDGCGCKIAPGVLSEILKNTNRLAVPAQLLVGIETADDAAVYQLTDDIALIATTGYRHAAVRPAHPKARPSHASLRAACP